MSLGKALAFRSFSYLPLYISSASDLPFFLFFFFRSLKDRLFIASIKHMSSERDCFFSLAGIAQTLIQYFFYPLYL